MKRPQAPNGTAKDLNGSGDVRGKTGEAEFNGGSHAWFAGYRGDMALAALIVGGGSSEYAVRMLKGMLGQLPPDYLASDLWCHQCFEPNFGPFYLRSEGT